MKINANKKDNVIEFIPEGDLDSYRLGMVFGKKSHSLTQVPSNKIKNVTVKVSDIWCYLLEASVNA